MPEIFRTPNGWQQDERHAGETVHLEDPGLSISVDELYEAIQLEEA